MTAAEQKKGLRRQLKRMRQQLAVSQAKLQKDVAVYGRVTEYISKTKPAAVLTYLSTRIEVDTRSIIRFCFENNIPVAVPRCEGKEMRFCRINSFSDTEKGGYGIFEPKQHCEQIIPTESMLCIVPALCFDRYGHRLGYGGGYYDRFLSKYKVQTVGICYKEYLFNSIPTEENDKAVEVVLTD
ncbi:MAG: 5-formyltetrahydrofolate cyclo-ligase [Eubacterium sp.]|nr:5-formyltetrahydrofolate cyclo-ligase [Eubacterium sp.]